MTNARVRRHLIASWRLWDGRLGALCINGQQRRRKSPGSSQSMSDGYTVQKPTITKHWLVDLRDARYQEMPDDSIPSQKYRDTDIRRYFVMPVVVDNLSKNSQNNKKDK